jgi:hypothetical protein
VADASVAEVQSIPGYEDEAKAEAFIAECQKIADAQAAAGPAPVTDAKDATKSLADLRLKAEMDKLNKENKAEDAASSSSEEKA